MYTSTADGIPEDEEAESPDITEENEVGENSVLDETEEMDRLEMVPFDDVEGVDFME